LLWALFVVGAVIALELAWFLLVGPANQYHGAADSTAANYAGGQDYPWWQYSGAWIAIFTIVLTCSTIALWITGRDAARAAQKGVEALPIVERGYAYPLISNPGAINEAIASTVGAEVSFKIKNYGKTPIVLNLVIAGCGTRRTLGRDSSWLSVDDPILGNGEETRPIECTLNLELPNGLREALSGLALNPIFLEGRIVYSDIWENEFQTWFRFIWEEAGPLDLGRWRLSGLKVEKYDSEKELKEFVET
jgi:hypothetical protein